MANVYSDANTFRIVCRHACTSQSPVGVLNTDSVIASDAHAIAPCSSAPFANSTSTGQNASTTSAGRVKS
eukprot:3662471-Rhodomonas_salina.1